MVSSVLRTMGSSLAALCRPMPLFKLPSHGYLFMPRNALARSSGRTVASAVWRPSMSVLGLPPVGLHARMSTPIHMNSWMSSQTCCSVKPGRNCAPKRNGSWLEQQSRQQGRLPDRLSVACQECMRPTTMWRGCLTRLMRSWTLLSASFSASVCASVSVEPCASSGPSALGIALDSGHLLV